MRGRDVRKLESSTNLPLLHGFCALLLVTASGACGGGAGSITTDQLRPLRTLNSNERLDADDSLDARMTSIAQQLEHAGLSRGGIWQRGFAPSGSRETLRLEIPGDTCATIVALASSGIRDVDATLYLPDGTLVAQDSQPDSHPTLQVCAEGVGRYFYYTLHAYEGAGAYLVASFLSDRSLFARAAAIVGGRPGVAQGVALSPEGQVVQMFSESVQRRGFLSAKDPVRLILAATQSVRVPVTVELARCYTVAAFALDGVEDINLRVLDEEGRDVAFDTTGSRDAATQFCADRAAQFSAELTAVRGEGAAVVAVYSVPEADVGGDNGLWLGARSSEQLSTRSLQDALRDDAVQAVETGYTRPSIRVRGRLTTGEVTSHVVALKAGTCTRIAATGGHGSGVMWLDIVDLAPEFTSAVARKSDSNVEVCSPRAADVRALVVSRRGDGDYAVSTATKAFTER